MTIEDRIEIMQSVMAQIDAVVDELRRLENVESDVDAKKILGRLFKHQLGAKVATVDYCAHIRPRTL